MADYWFEPKEQGYGAVPINGKGLALTLIFAVAVIAGIRGRGDRWKSRDHLYISGNMADASSGPVLHPGLSGGVSSNLSPEDQRTVALALAGPKGPLQFR